MPHNASTWYINMTTLPGYFYEYDEAVSPEAPWVHPTTYGRTATGFVTTVAIPAPTNSPRFFRALRIGPNP